MFVRSYNVFCREVRNVKITLDDATYEQRRTGQVQSQQMSINKTLVPG